MHSTKLINKVLILCGLLAFAISTAAQMDESALRDNIIKRGGTIPSIKKKDALIDTLSRQVANLDSLVAILDAKIVGIEKKLAAPPQTINYSLWPLPVISGDSAVFKTMPLDAEVPPSLAKQYKAMCIVAQISQTLDKTEGDIRKIKAVASDVKLNVNQSIKDAIADDVDTIYSLFGQLKNEDDKIFSTEQQAYIDSLKERYNSLSQYFK